jgi:predicted ester cyclase
MTSQEIRKIVDDHLNAEARHDAEAAAATYAPHGYYHQVPLGLLLEGRDAVAAGYASSFAAFPDSEMSNEGEVVEGNHYVHWGRFRGTLTGSWLGLPPTNRRLDMPFAAVIEVREGRMIGEALYYDLDTLCTQAGHTVEAVRAAADAIRRARAGAQAAA